MSVIEQASMPYPSSGQIVDGKHVLTARVYYEDTDAGGVVYHARYLHFAERARTELMRCLGDAYQADILDQGLGIVVRKCDIDYQRAAKLDDCLEIATSIVSVKGSSMVMRQEISQLSDTGKQRLTVLDVLLVCVDLKKMRPVRIPQSVRTGCEQVLIQETKA